MAELGRYVSAKYIAQALGITQSGIFNLIKAGIFPPGVKIGRSRRWELSEVRNWLNERKEAGHV